MTAACAMLSALLCVGAYAARTQSTSAPETVALPIVMYHHIAESDALLGKYVISPAELENDLAYLRSAGYESVSVQQLLDWSEGKCALPEKPCMITFDDGYESTGVYAAPLLEKYGFTGVVAVIGSVAEQYSREPDHNLRYSHLDWSAAAALQRSGVMEMQCHSWAMHELKPRKGCDRIPGESAGAYRAALTEDTERFLDGCAEHGAEPVPAVAYPFGAYCAQTVEILRDMGFRVGFTCTEKVNHVSGEAAELMELGRFNRPHGPSAESFFGKWE